MTALRAILTSRRPRWGSFEDRARSYLHANCAHCHHPGGNAIASFHLRRELPFDKLNTNKGSGIGTFGLIDPKIITPGEPTRSLLLYRMSKLGYARMPYIGSRVVDSAGVELVADWIASLDPKGSSSVSLPKNAAEIASRPVDERSSGTVDDPASSLASWRTA
jgi:hypothetical protein